VLIILDNLAEESFRIAKSIIRILRALTKFTPSYGLCKKKVSLVFAIPGLHSDDGGIRFNLPDMSPIARRFFIGGEVQGVGYRFFAQRAAARHQVVGYVKNLDDGRVEVLADGPAHQVEAFKHELATGPRFSSVDHVEEINLDPSGLYPTFRIES
jgi:acylphosphatase